MSRRTSQWLAKLILLGISLGFAGVCAEVGLRLLGRDEARVWEPDPQVGWHPIAGARRHWIEEGNGLIQINSIGFRDRERSVTGNPSVTRIAIFGDSMTEADQVNLDETYASRLEAQLRRDGQNVEVLNFGVTGYSPVQELLLFEREAPKFRPQVVVLALFLDNDVSGCHPALSVAPDAPFATPGDNGLRIDYSRAESSWAGYHRQPFYLLRKYSAIYRTVSTARQRWNATGGGAARAATVPTRFELYEQTPPRPWDDAWRNLESVVLAFVGTANQLGIEPVLLSVPAAQVVDHRAWEHLLQQFPAMQNQQWDLEGPERRLRAFADANHLRLIQPYKQFESLVQAETLYFGEVGHMTALGHQHLAEGLAPFFTDEHLMHTGSEARVR